MSGDGRVKAPRWFRGKSSTWHKSREWTRSRANGRCEVRQHPDCPGRGNQAHHILPRSKGGTDGTDNLLWVCDQCHRWVHWNAAESTARGWLQLPQARSGDR